MIQITDLKRQYQALAAELQPVMERVCQSGYFIKGPELAAFESEIAAYLGVPYAVGVNSGTDALVLALKALGIGPGDQVITSGMSFLATAAAISLTGARPVFVDIDPRSDCLRVDLIEAAITPATRAIMPVHLHGYPCDMQPLKALAEQYDLKIVEDCAQSIGARYQGQMTGSIGDLGCFSFFPTKNLGAFGDGGLVVTASEQHYQQLMLLREYGCEVKNVQQALGTNSRLDALQAAILRVKLPYLEGWNQRRRELAQGYHDLLAELEAADLGLRRPPLEIFADSYSVFHHYALRVPQRDWVMAQMKAAGYECLPYYPLALHMQKLYADAYQPEALPESRACAEQTLALPLFPELEPAEQVSIVAQLKACLLDVQHEQKA